MKAENKKPRIFIDKNGNWYQDGLKITHRWTYLENNKNLDMDEEGTFFVDEGYGRVYVEVEDTPFVIKMVSENKGIFTAVLNDETGEQFSPGEITICEKNVPYIMVKNKRFKARFTSRAYYELAKHIVQDGDDFYINTENGKVKISIDNGLI